MEGQRMLDPISSTSSGKGNDVGVGATALPAAASTSSPCGACKFLRRKCVRECIFAPHFGCEAEGAARFAAVHKVFGASNVSKLLQRIPEHRRSDAVQTITYEAQFRMANPVYGCVSEIFRLQHEVESLQAQLLFINAQLASTRHMVAMSMQAIQPPQHNQHPHNHTPHHHQHPPSSCFPPPPPPTPLPTGVPLFSLNATPSPFETAVIDGVHMQQQHQEHHQHQQLMKAEIQQSSHAGHKRLQHAHYASEHHQSNNIARMVTSATTDPVTDLEVLHDDDDDAAVMDLQAGNDTRSHSAQVLLMRNTNPLCFEPGIHDDRYRH